MAERNISTNRSDNENTMGLACVHYWLLGTPPDMSQVCTKCGVATEYKIVEFDEHGYTDPEKQQRSRDGVRAYWANMSEARRKEIRAQQRASHMGGYGTRYPRKSKYS